MKAIGGYFELELDQREEYHKNAIRLNTGRNSLEYILRVRNYDKVYLPYYTCAVVLEPFQKLNIKYEFYSISEEFEPIINVELKENEAILITNYFGLTSEVVKRITLKYKKCIVDNSQAFFEKPIKGVDTFYSARKFFGVTDGAYLYCDEKLNYDIVKDISYKRFEHILGRIDIDCQTFYQKSKNNENLFKNQDIKIMSNITQSILKSIDYEKIKDKRTNNFTYLHEKLKKTNQLKIIDNAFSPMAYPYLTNNGEQLKKELIKNNIFVATYWDSVRKLVEKSKLEYNLSQNLVVIPIDQRYGEKDFERVLEIITSN